MQSSESSGVDPFERVYVTAVGAETTGQIFKKVAEYKRRYPEKLAALDEKIRKYVEENTAHYVLFDDRVWPLVMAVKSWGRRVNVLDSQNGKLNSFTLTMMVIHFLQCVVSPPILPNLCNLFPSVFLAEKVPLHRFPLNHDHCIPNLKTRLAQNHLSVSELLLGFFIYYADFRFDLHAIYVRLGKRVDREPALQRDSDAGEMFIEEPYERYNTMRTMRNPLERIGRQSAFRSSAALMDSDDGDILGLIGIEKE
ncbi:hypothetical protein QR680_002931 [Steinernema hermaphroditum]|uniref:PAP-associated domain-containing protein n=1 Tax=Steinernema hermaphroditum TaxID=289476 RepID=A0AA39H4P1_9BILA|nr:hypothetical protein QR680_002931 [Steinernema hermaphroditum]